MIYLTKSYCGPCISHDAFPLDGKTHFLFYFVKIWFFFFKEKQNKKENSKCDSLFGKDSMWQTKYKFEGQVTYREGMIKTIAPL